MLTVSPALLVAMVLAVAGIAMAAAVEGPVHLGRDSVVSRLLAQRPDSSTGPSVSTLRRSPTTTRPGSTSPGQSPAGRALGWLAWVAAGTIFAFAVRGMLREKSDDPLAGAKVDLDVPGPTGAPGGGGGLADVLRRAAWSAAATARDGGPPQDAVVACWVALEAAGRDAGTQRAPTMTPTEFTAAVLAEHDADPLAVDQLLHLYHRARFATAPAGASISRADAEAAATALDRIAASLRATS